MEAGARLCVSFLCYCPSTGYPCWGKATATAGHSLLLWILSQAPMNIHGHSALSVLMRSSCPCRLWFVFTGTNVPLLCPHLAVLPECPCGWPVEISHSQLAARQQQICPPASPLHKVQFLNKYLIPEVLKLPWLIGPLMSQYFFLSVSGPKETPNNSTH